MAIPTPGQKDIPLADWKRFLRVADWFERTVEQGNGTRQPSYGQSLIVKTPEDGIDARSDTTIFSATCIKCVAVETATPGERTIHETDEELVVYNAEAQDVPGEIFVKTTLSPKGTRYVDRGQGFDRCNALLKGAMNGESTFIVDNVVETRGHSPVDSSSEELTVHNIHGWAGDDNAICKIEYNYKESRWEFYQVTCPA